MYETSINEPLPTPGDIQMPQEPAAAPYFTSWVTPLIIKALEKEGVPKKDAAYQAYYGNLKIHLTIDLQMQAAAQKAVNAEFPYANSPTASLVAIDNSNGEVRAMVSGDGNYNKSSFNLATLGYRQPGSAFKMFTLAAALTSGKYSPDSLIPSEPYTIHYGEDNSGKYVVHNFDNAYAGETSLASATATSDNSVFARVGMSVGTQAIANYAKAMGIRTPISKTPAMILGGLTTGVSALDMAHAYETVATGGKKVYNNVLGDYQEGAIGIDSISGCTACRQSTIQNTTADGLQRQPELTPAVASTIDELLHGPVDDPSGTGTAAAIPGVDVVGKTGTTSNYVDAWFVGWTPQMTVAVWVGYPSNGKPMTTNFDGGPVEGGTYPAIIWHNFMIKALQIMADETAAKEHKTPPNLDYQLVTTARQQSNSAQTTTSTPATTNGANQAAGTNNTKATQAGTQPSATNKATNTTPNAIPNAPANTSAGSGTKGVTSTPAVTTTPSTTGTSTNGGTGL